MYRKLKFTPVPSDQFSAFGETVIQRLRAMGEVDALCTMAQISTTIFAQVFTTCNLFLCTLFLSHYHLYYRFISILFV